MNLDNINLDKIESLESGFFGTKCKGSVPLPNFTAEYESDIQKLIAKGQSTSIWKYPDVFLKTDANNPISTSGVCDCSVFYLFNIFNHFAYILRIYCTVLQQTQSRDCIDTGTKERNRDI